MDPGPMLRRARLRAGLSQLELANRVGVSESVVGDYERGRFSPTVRQLERLLAAAGFQIAAELEPLGADLDTVVEEFLAQPLTARLGDMCFVLEDLHRLLDGVPYVIEGLAAALLQGAPVPVDAVDLAVPNDEQQLSRLAESFSDSGIVRFWDPDQRRYRLVGVVAAHFREFGTTTRWHFLDGEVRIRLADPAEVVPAAHVEVGGIRLPVAGLWQVETGDERVGAMLARTRAIAAALSRQAGSGPRTA